MTEYWVSKQSYFCKYCDIYIRDDAPSKAQHENGLRHKGNLERYIRDIYKKEDRLQKERADEAQQVSKIDEAARRAHQEKDVPAPPKPDEAEGDEGSDSRKRIKYSKQDWRGAENLQNYSDARSLGLVDAEAEIEAAKAVEAEAELRAKEGRVGQWEAVVKLVQPVQKEKNHSKGHEPPKLVSKLSNDRDPDKKPIGKWFTERCLEDDSEREALEQLDIKVKVDRRRQAQKLEDTPVVPGSLHPIRLDGLMDDPSELGQKDSFSPPLQTHPPEDQDVKPKVEELEAPPNSTNLFKKRKLKTSTPRQKA